MAWITTVPEEAAEGLLRRIYAEARRRAGRVWCILKVMSVNPAQLRVSMTLYQSVMLGDSALSRRERELLGVVVSRANDCHY